MNGYDSIPFDQRPDRVEAALDMAVAHHKQGRDNQAEIICRRILDNWPDCVQAAAMLGLLLIQNGRPAEAIQALQTVLRLNPNDFTALNNLGLALHRCGRLEDAAKAFSRVLDVKPDYLKAYYNLGNVFQDMGNTDATIECYRAALELIPDDSRAQHMMGRLYLEHHYLNKARAHFETAVKLDPQFADAWMSLASTALMQGDYRTGWPLYRWRFKTAGHHARIYPFRHSWPLWQGEPFDGRRLLVHCEQGLGDSLQFSRFLPQVKALGGELVFQVQPSLMSLFETSPYIDSLLPLTDVFPGDMDVDIYVPLLDLPACLDADESAIRSDWPYLKADDKRIRKWKQKIPSNGCNIGVVWSGNPLFVHNERRSCDPRFFIPIGRIEGVQLFSLQKVADEADLHALSDGCGTIHLGRRLSCFGETAAAIHCLDLVITVCTSVAHMAGAMGKRVWLLLNNLPDWRWGLHGTTTSWYCSMRLFRQPKPGDWVSVFDSVTEALKTELDHGRGARDPRNL